MGSINIDVDRPSLTSVSFLFLMMVKNVRDDHEIAFTPAILLFRPPNKFVTWPNEPSVLSVL